MEQWKDIPWYVWRYQASNLGNIKTLKGKHKEKILKWAMSNCWYLHYRLYYNKKYTQKTAHRLVMIAFKWESNLDVNHIDWNKINNNLENLEYCTKSENMKHAFKNGLCKVKRGKEHHLYWKLWKDNKDSVKIKQLDLQWNLIKIWDSMADVKRELWLSAWNICMVCKWIRNHTWWYKWSYVA